MEILESEIQEQKQQIHWMLSTTNEDREMSKWSWRQTTEIIQSKEHKEIRHGKKKKTSCRDLWDNRWTKIYIISPRPIPMFNGKLLKETQFDKALYSSDHKEEKKNRIVDSVKLISGAISKVLVWDNILIPSNFHQVKIFY